MAMPSEAAPATAPLDQERRLHPWSPLFVLIQQLKQFALPLLVLLFTGRGNSYELWGLVGAGVLVLLSLAQYFTYRYRIDREGLVIRSGLFQRSLRHIPFDRIHNVGLHQSVLHRLFGVAEVRLESAGGAKPEGQMRVLSLADAHRLEQQIRTHGRELAAAASPDAAPLAEPVQPLLELDTGEVLRLGLISNRGMIVVAAAIGALAQVGDGLLVNVIDASGIKQLVTGMMGWSDARHFGVIGAVLVVLLLFVLAVVALRLLSMGLALLQYHGFQLVEQGPRLSAQRGLLTRLRSSLPRHRIQAWSLTEGMLHRWFDRQSLRVDSVAMDTGNQQGSLRDLIPIATPLRMAELVRYLLPAGQWPPQRWQPLHPMAWRRQFMLPALLSLLVGALLFWRFGTPALAMLLAPPLLLLRAKVWAAHAAFAEENGLVAVREGWLDKSWRFAEIRKLQAIELRQSPFDRRHGMASLHLDTAGANPMEPALRIRYLDETEARALHARLSAQMH